MQSAPASCNIQIVIIDLLPNKKGDISKPLQKHVDYNNIARNWRATRMLEENAQRLSP